MRRLPLDMRMKAHDYQNRKSIIRGKSISRFKSTLHKVKGPRD
jgi:hypothetical protein